VLSAIYEQDFLSCSFGGRPKPPNCGCHLWDLTVRLARG
jgi:hypothetical protein